MIISNKRLGNDFERFFCDQLFFNGFWVHNFAQNKSGQPSDVIAVKHGKAILIDCKVCTDTGFTFSRIEENQDTSMSYWNACGNGTGWFALRYRKNIYMVDHSDLTRQRNQGKKRLSGEEIKRLPTFEQWIKTI